MSVSTKLLYTVMLHIYYFRFICVLGDLITCRENKKKV